MNGVLLGESDVAQFVFAYLRPISLLLDVLLYQIFHALLFLLLSFLVLLFEALIQPFVALNHVLNLVHVLTFEPFHLLCSLYALLMDVHNA